MYVCMNIVRPVFITTSLVIAVLSFENHLSYETRIVDIFRCRQEKVKMIGLDHTHQDKPLPDLHQIFVASRLSFPFCHASFLWC